ncbi:hypothetical protein RF11_04495 [Thelohanellus kitauei]|uniref:Tc1-like transposase DDE domain-containing protein n=1 Tax=Thelohanellus kitauei TaxID=669202 RepID=A0A0C2MZK6_THEKT|nr:hypothetical protein RF11_04495 [Thelohanellus kitauei]
MRSFFERHNIRIGRFIERVPLSLSLCIKIIRHISERRKDPQNILERKEYALNFLRIAQDPQKLFFIDETGFQEFEPTRVVPALRSRNYSVVYVMSCEGMVNFKISEWAYINECFLNISGNIGNLSSTRDFRGLPCNA